MKTTTISLDTSSRRFVDLTEAVAAFIPDGATGLVNVFVPHATAGLAVIETGSGTEGDLEDALGRLLPREDIYAHRHGSQGHGADHVLPAFLTPSVCVPVVGGRMTLGTWQSVVLVDTNRDNTIREVRFSFLAG